MSFFLFSQDECFVLVLFANLDQNWVILGYFGYHHSQQTAISQIYKPSWHLMGHELQLCFEEKKGSVTFSMVKKKALSWYLVLFHDLIFFCLHCWIYSCILLQVHWSQMLWIHPTTLLRFTWILMVVQPTWLMECRMGSLHCVPLVEDAHGWWAQKYTSILYAYRNSTETGKDYCNDIIRQFLPDESDGFWLDQLDTVWICRARPT